MPKLKTFFFVLKNSFTNSHYYYDIIKAPFIFSLKYFLFFFFLISIYNNFYWHFDYLPKMKVKTFQIFNEIQKNFPYNLIISYDSNGGLKSSLNPLFISYPSFFDDKNIFFEKGKFIVVNNLLNQSNLSSMASTSAIAINDKDIFFQDGENVWVNRSFPIETIVTWFSLSSMTINYQTLPMILEDIKVKLLIFYDQVTLVVLFLSPLLFIFWKILLSIFESFFVYLFFKLFNLKLTYKKIW